MCGGEGDAWRFSVGHAADLGPAADLGHEAGCWLGNLEGGLGGLPPPNVDGGHHFRRKCDFATENAIFCAATLGPRAAAFLRNYVYI